MVRRPVVDGGLREPWTRGQRGFRLQSRCFSLSVPFSVTVGPGSLGEIQPLHPCATVDPKLNRRSPNNVFLLSWLPRVQRPLFGKKVWRFQACRPVSPRSGLVDISRAGPPPLRPSGSREPSLQGTRRPKHFRRKFQLALLFVDISPLRLARSTITHHGYER